MASSQRRNRRRWSKDYPPSFAMEESKYYELYKSIIAFLKLWEESPDRLFWAVREIKETSQQIQALQEKTESRKTVGLVTLGVGGVLALLAAPLTGGASVAALVAGAATGAAGAGAGIGAISADRRTDEKIEQRKRQEKELTETVEQLRMRLNDVKRICKELMKTEGDENMRRRLQNLVKKIDQSVISEASVSEVVVENILSRFNNITTVFEMTLLRLNIKCYSERLHILNQQL